MGCGPSFSPILRPNLTKRGYPFLGPSTLIKVREVSGMKIGIYGGTFNPPHLGHLAAAKTAIEVLGLDRLLLIPAAV